MKKTVIILIVLSTAQLGICQVDGFKYPKIDTGDCYVFARGTKSKQSFISRQFNSMNDSITHIGIGIRIDSVFRIYNVNPVKNANALTADTYESFASPDDLMYLGVWKLDLNDVQKNRVRNKISSMPGYINFDYDFEIDSRIDKMYCSEFCWTVTNEIGDEFLFALKKKPLKELGLDKILMREILAYVPVDYFLAFKNIEFCGSWYKGK